MIATVSGRTVFSRLPWSRSSWFYFPREHPHGVVQSKVQLVVLLSSTSVKELEGEMASESQVMLRPVESSDGLVDIAWHGPGDGCITLNVGGKEFHTLRSTLYSNAVLAGHVAKAEANSNITKNGAIFIDREPEHFDFILRHLRNRMDLSSVTAHLDKKSLLQYTKSHIELPKDTKALNKLYEEATYYRIPELQNAICKRSWIANVTTIFNKNGNPFESATKLLVQIRTGLLAAGTIGGTVLVSMQDEIDGFLKKIGLRKDDTSSNSSPSLAEG
jgi:BTB/POZ domain